MQKQLVMDRIRWMFFYYYYFTCTHNSVGVLSHRWKDLHVTVSTSELSWNEIEMKRTKKKKNSIKVVKHLHNRPNETTNLSFRILIGLFFSFTPPYKAAFIDQICAHWQWSRAHTLWTVLSISWHTQSNGMAMKTICKTLNSFAQIFQILLTK